MHITRTSLSEAAEHGVLTAQQAVALWDFLADRGRDTPSFKAAHILYYLGGLIAIGAMTLFMTMGWERFGGTGLLIIAVCYIGVALGATQLLLRAGLAIPAGITAALAVALVPLAIYGAQVMLGFWPVKPHADWGYRDYHVFIDWRWVVMESGTLLAGAIALWRFRLPFMVMPVAVTLWYMSMDLVPFLLGGNSSDFFSERGKLISMWFGLGMTLLAFYVDVRARRGHDKDFAFWLYLFGVLAFWGGLSTMRSGSELSRLVYCLINLLMIGIGGALSRRVFAVFGGLGVAGYLGHLSYSVFKDSMVFPVALTAIGFAVIAAGVYWQRHEAQIGSRLRSWLPAPLRELVEQRAA